MSVALIWAQARGGVIGANGVMPWHLPEDLAHFRQLTGRSPVVMGRRTWDSLPERFRPLPDRTNIVVTRQTGWVAEGAVTVHSVGAALAASDDAAGIESITWVIGGSQLYRSTIDLADRLEVTEIDAEVEGDTFAPTIGAGWEAISTDPIEGWHTSRTGLRYRLVRYSRAAATIGS